jgi:hypothetical protein
MEVEPIKFPKSVELDAVPGWLIPAFAGMDVEPVDLRIVNGQK